MLQPPSLGNEADPDASSGAVYGEVRASLIPEELTEHEMEMEAGREPKKPKLEENSDPEYQHAQKRDELDAKALNYSIKTYEEMKKNNQILYDLGHNPVEALKMFEKQPGRFVHFDFLMFYIHSMYPSGYSWFQVLRINRTEEGFLLYPGICNRQYENSRYLLWDATKAHQYTELFDRLESAAAKEGILSNHNSEEIYNLPQSFIDESKEMAKNLHELDEDDVILCGMDVCKHRFLKILEQRVNFFDLVSKDAEKGREHFESGNVQELFPLLDSSFFDDVINLFYQGKKRNEGIFEAASRRQKLDARLVFCKEQGTPLAHYYRLKLQIAKALDIVKFEDERYVEIMQFGKKEIQTLPWEWSSDEEGDDDAAVQME